MFHVLIFFIQVADKFIGASVSEPHTSESNWDFSFIIGTSLSEPHTSVTAFRTCVCMLACLLACLLAAIYRKF